MSRTFRVIPSDLEKSRAPSGATVRGFINWSHKTIEWLWGTMIDHTGRVLSLFTAPLGGWDLLDNSRLRSSALESRDVVERSGKLLYRQRSSNGRHIHCPSLSHLRTYCATQCTTPHYSERFFK
jgi:hypothetical protein